MGISPLPRVDSHLRRENDVSLPTGQWMCSILALVAFSRAVETRLHERSFGLLPFPKGLGSSVPEELGHIIVLCPELATPPLALA